MRVINWQRALLLWFQDKVEVLEYHTVAARSSRDVFPIPSVMRLKKYLRPWANTGIKMSRENIYRRDNHRCQYCGDPFPPKELTFDHVTPVSKGGRKDWNNIVTACRECNHRKGNRTPIEANMPLLTMPRRPTIRTTFDFDLNIEIVPSTWMTYLATLKIG